MLLLMDESGDRGLKVGQGSTPWLVLGAVLFPTLGDGDRCRDAIRALQEKLGGREFHFTKDPPERRKPFIECVREFEYTFHCVACNKSRLNLKTWQKPAHLLKEVSGHLIASISANLKECLLRFDTLGGNSSDKEYGNHIQRKAGKLDGAFRICSFTSQKSDKEVLIQLTDYVCGSVHRSVVGGKKGSQEYRSIFKKREGSVVFWPEKKEAD